MDWHDWAMATIAIGGLFWEVVVNYWLLILGMMMAIFFLGLYLERRHLKQQKLKQQKDAPPEFHRLPLGDMGFLILKRRWLDGEWHYVARADQIFIGRRKSPEAEFDEIQRLFKEPKKRRFFGIDAFNLRCRWPMKKLGIKTTVYDPDS